jgi:hypothetical protein
MTIKGEGSATIMKLRGYAITKAVDVKIATALRATRERIDGLSSLRLSPLEVQVKDRMIASVEESDLTVEGTFKDNAFAGEAAFNMQRLRFAGHRVSESQDKGNSGDTIFDTGVMCHHHSEHLLS